MVQIKFFIESLLLHQECPVRASLALLSRLDATRAGEGVHAGRKSVPGLRYTPKVDRVKLGRALGYGTRHAVRTLAAVADAATASTPEAPITPEAARPQARVAEPRTGVAPSTPPVAGAVQRAASRPRRAAVRAAGRGVWAPLAAFSGALWLRVTGIFFSLIAVIMASAAWRLRGAAQANGQDAEAHQHFWIFTVVAALFAYFALSGFVRAARRERTSAAGRR